MSAKPLRVLAASGQLGYGFSEDSLHRALSMSPAFIGCDGGSMDPGPYYLGAGEPFVSARAMHRDLELLLTAARSAAVPLLIGSAGGGGGEPHLALVRDQVRDIARRRGLHFRLALIHAEPPRELLRARLAQGRVKPLWPASALRERDIDEAVRIVAMMGVEPYQRALGEGADVVLAGRSSDAALFAAIPLARGAHPGLSWHMAKIIECAGQVIEPRSGQDCVLGSLAGDHFVIEPGHPHKRCSRLRVSAHVLYENPHPYRVVEPGGTLDTVAARYEQIDPRRVRVTGSRFEPAATYTVKLEGVRATGFRCAFLAGVRDPGLIACVDDFVRSCRARTAEEARALGIDASSYEIHVKLYGRDAVMGEREPERGRPSHELGLLAQVTANDESISRAVLAKLRYALLHTDFPGRKCISGNLAIPLSPSDIALGPGYEFHVWHAMEVDDPMEPFSLEIEEL